MMMMTHSNPNSSIFYGSNGNCCTEEFRMLRTIRMIVPVYVAWFEVAIYLVNSCHTFGIRFEVSSESFVNVHYRFVLVQITRNFKQHHANTLEMQKSNPQIGPEWFILRWYIFTATLCAFFLFVRWSAFFAYTDWMFAYICIYGMYLVALCLCCVFASVPFSLCVEGNYEK